MSRFGVAFFRELKDRFGADADIGFREAGYLLLAGEQGRGVLEANHRVQTNEGADIALLDASAALAEKFPWLNVDDLAAGAWGRSGEGWFDAHALLALFAKRRATKARPTSMVRWRSSRASAIASRRSCSRTDGVSTVASSSTRPGRKAGDVAAMAGVPLPVEPRKRSVFVVACREAFPGMPLIVDPTGVWLRPEGQMFICGVSPEADADPRADGDFEVDYAQFDEIVWPALAHRVPAMESLKLQRAWAGHYDFNTLDQNAIVGAHPELSNFYFANGFSGHGLQQSPATGRAIAELIVHGRFVALDLSVFGYARIVEGRPVHELNVI